MCLPLPSSIALRPLHDWLVNVCYHVQMLLAAKFAHPGEMAALSSTYISHHTLLYLLFCHPVAHRQQTPHTSRGECCTHSSPLSMLTKPLVYCNCSDQTYFQNVAAARALLGQYRGFQSSALLLETANVVVPPMGESITEGSIANVLKKPGASACSNHSCHSHAT